MATIQESRAHVQIFAGNPLDQSRRRPARLRLHYAQLLLELVLLFLELLLQLVEFLVQFVAVFLNGFVLH